MEDKCPFCGAKAKDPRMWVCDTAVSITNPGEPVEYYRSRKCYEVQLQSLTARLAEAEGFIQEIADAKLLRYPHFNLHFIREWKDKAQTFLSAQDPSPVGEMVTVRRDDVIKAIDFIENTGGIYWGEVASRLKATLKEKS